MPIPEHLLADEKHETCCGKKIYIASTAGEGVMLGAEVSPSASTDDLKEAYGVVKTETQVIDPEYAPKTVNTDGWAGTTGA